MSHRTLCALALSICCVIPLLSASAQLADPQPGSWVRVRAPSKVEGDLIGTLVSRTADSIVVARSDSDVLRLPMSALKSIDMYRGRNWMLGAFIGGALALPLGYFWGLQNAKVPCYSSTSTPCVRDKGAVIVLSMLYLGAPASVIGAFFGPQRWQAIDLPIKVGLSPMSTPRGVGVAMQISLPTR